MPLNFLLLTGIKAYPRLGWYHVGWQELVCSRPCNAAMMNMPMDPKARFALSNESAHVGSKAGLESVSLEGSRNGFPDLGRGV